MNIYRVNGAAHRVVKVLSTFSFKFQNFNTNAELGNHRYLYLVGNTTRKQLNHRLECYKEPSNSFVVIFSRDQLKIVSSVFRISCYLLHSLNLNLSQKLIEMANIER